ncbi:MAG: phosphoenolpyruvate synthase [Patescibacteria group bacterium]
MAKKNVVWFEEVTKEDVGLVGGKGANLGEMTNAKLPVPYGFIVTSNSYFHFVKENNLANKIRQTLEVTNVNNPSELRHASQTIKSLIKSAPMPKDLAREIMEYYEELPMKQEKYFNSKVGALGQSLNKIKNLYNPPLVAVRSSATAEDLPQASFAGQQETYLNVKGEAHVVEKVKDCFASLFTERAIFYRTEQKFDHFKVGLAAVVQKMVESERSGIAFSVDPISQDKNTIVIEAIKGLGEYIVGGNVTPDHYEVNKKSFVITNKQIKFQKAMLVKYHGGNREIRLGKGEGSIQKLTDAEIVKLAVLISDVEKHYFFPQDIEWAMEKKRMFIVQSRPITTLGHKAKSSDGETITEAPILVGAPASPGVATGPVKIITSPKEIDKIQHGDILVAPQTNPDYVPAMKKAAAIVTESGGRTSHAAIVSRELGIPAVVGAAGATKVLKHVKVVTVNGQVGEVYKGKVISSFANAAEDKSKSPVKKLKTVTRVYVNLAEVHEAPTVAKMDVDGVGLLRAEFMIANIGVHPKEFIKNKMESVFINRLSRDLLKFVVPFSPRQVVYRATDFKTNEYRNLKGGKMYEPHEENPMLGFRGAYRYIANPDVFKMELMAIKKVWEKGYRNLHLMIPFVRTPWELLKIKQMVQEVGLLSYPDFKLWIMVEVPSCALNLEEFLKLGINGVSIGTNDLTMMLLGVDRDSTEVASLYDERTPIVVSVLEYIVRTCKKYGVTASICGQAASDYPDLVERLVAAGITSVSVNPDAVNSTREHIYEIEKKHFSKVAKK